jgi:hypothetical protein
MATSGGDHRLAALAAMNAAGDFESARQDSHSPTGGGDPGVTLSPGMSVSDLASLGMSPDAVIPDRGPLVPPGFEEGPVLDVNP